MEYSIGKKKRAKKDDEDGEVNYINERNKVFNKKISRYFDKYTKEYVFYNAPFECHLHVYAKCGILGFEQTLRGELLFETVIKPATKLFSSFLRHVTLIQLLKCIIVSFVAVICSHA